MLVLSRRIGESFVIGDDLEVTVVNITGEKVVLGVVAPKTVRIERMDAPESVSGASINRHGYGRRQKNKLTDGEKQENP